PKKKVGAADRFFEKIGPAATSEHSFVGMIKRTEGDPDSVSFARPGDCTNWIAIPASRIEEIRPLHQSVTCGGRPYPLGQVFMKSPAVDSEAEIFATLASLHHASTASLHGAWWPSGRPWQPDGSPQSRADQEPPSWWPPGRPYPR